MFSVSVDSAPFGAGIFKASGGLSSDDLLGHGSAREISCRAARHRLDEPRQVIPQHGCVPAEPASVWLGEVIVAPNRGPISYFAVPRDLLP